MISPETLALLRCPLDLSREAPLVLEEDLKIYCSRCRVRFPIRDGLPCLIPEEAELPEGCTIFHHLPCRQ